MDTSISVNELREDDLDAVSAGMTLQIGVVIHSYNQDDIVQTGNQITVVTNDQTRVDRLFPF